MKYVFKSVWCFEKTDKNIFKHYELELYIIFNTDKEYEIEMK